MVNFSSPRTQETVRGIYRPKNARIGVVYVEGGMSVAVPAHATKGALSGDTVECATFSHAVDDKKPDGRILRVIERSKERLIGEVTEARKNEYRVTLLDASAAVIPVAREASSPALGTGTIVAIALAPDLRRATGRLESVVGRRGDRGLEERIIIERANMPTQFAADALEEAESMRTPRSFEGRRDYRNEWVSTIDGEDAKDLDDAIHVKLLPDGSYELGVHIADVSHYVREHTALDRSAIERSTSAYLGPQVIPMLPEKLSNDLCSLHPGSPKLTQSVVVRVTPEGKISLVELGESVIESRHRWSYDEAQAVLDGTRDATAYPEGLIETLRHARDLYAIIREKRKRGGKIDLDFPEIVLEYSDPFTVSAIRPRARNDAHRLIEEFMITANEAVAKFFAEKKIPFLYRVHERPDAIKLERLAELLSNYGIETSANALENPVELDRVAGLLRAPGLTPLLRYILTSLSKAEYSDKNLGHHGLGLRYYSHFTSPIRRYPDLQIHRIIKEYSRKELDGGRQAHYKKILPDVAVRTSALERRAERVEYDVRDTRLARYAGERVGEEREGTVTGSSEFGAYVTLDDGLEGFLFGRNLPVRTRWHEPSLELRDAEGRTYLRIGDRVRVRIAVGDPVLRRIDFEIIDENGPRRAARAGRSPDTKDPDGMAPQKRKRRRSRRGGKKHKKPQREA